MSFRYQKLMMASIFHTMNFRARKTLKISKLSDDPEVQIVLTMFGNRAKNLVALIM